MSYRRIPRRVRISGIWFDVREDYPGVYGFFEYMKASQYTAKEAYVHINNLFYVYNSNGNKVGEFHTENMTWEGCIEDLQM